MVTSITPIAGLTSKILTAAFSYTPVWHHFRFHVQRTVTMVNFQNAGQTFFGKLQCCEKGFRIQVAGNGFEQSKSS
jgi:hypothetical protein